jgi:hypothetical protein
MNFNYLCLLEIVVLLITCAYSIVKKSDSQERYKKILGSIIILIYVLVSMLVLQQKIIVQYNAEIILLFVFLTGYLFIPNSSKVLTIYLIMAPTIFLIFQSTQILTDSLQTPGIKVDRNTVKFVKYVFIAIFFVTVITVDSIASLLLNWSKLNRK